jgi:phosphatidylserine synthase
MAAFLDGRGVTAVALTAAGFGVGLGVCAAAATERWSLALVLWLGNRIIDGLDGAVARQGSGPTRFGAFIDLMADFAVYGGVVAAVAYALPETRLAAVVVIWMYYLNGAAYLAWSAPTFGQGDRDCSSPELRAGLAEGVETIVVYALILARPGWAVELLWTWAAVVAISATQRFLRAARVHGGRWPSRS